MRCWVTSILSFLSWICCSETNMARTCIKPTKAVTMKTKKANITKSVNYSRLKHRLARTKGKARSSPASRTRVNCKPMSIEEIQAFEQAWRKYKRSDLVAQDLNIPLSRAQYIRRTIREGSKAQLTRSKAERSCRPLSLLEAMLKPNNAKLVKRSGNASSAYLVLKPVAGRLHGLRIPQWQTVTNSARAIAGTLRIQLTFDKLTSAERYDLGREKAMTRSIKRCPDLFSSMAWKTCEV